MPKDLVVTVICTGRAITLLCTPGILKHQKRFGAGSFVQSLYDAQAEHTAADYYFDSYAHFGKPQLLLEGVHHLGAF